MLPKASAINKIAPSNTFLEVDVSAQDFDATNYQVKGVFVGGIGDLVVDDVADNEVTFKNVSGVLPISPKTVVSSGTTATDIVLMLEEQA